MDITTDKSFKYDLENLDSTSEEFMFVEQFYDITRNVKKYTTYSKKATHKQNFQIYKVNENNPKEPAEAKDNNLMLFHGTNRKGAVGILKEGFKNSEKGWFGQGVYMTDCSTIALYYSSAGNTDISKNYIFVNEVLES